MKALTLYQPWATLVAMGTKRVETRSWPSRHRGPLAIHASSTFPGWARDLIWTEPFASVLRAGIGVAAMFGASSPRYEVLPQGRIVCTCQLVDCYRITADNAPAEPERSFGDYTPGRWAWVLADAKPAARLGPRVKGRLGLWDYDERRA